MIRRLTVVSLGLVAAAVVLYSGGPYVACFVVEPVRQWLRPPTTTSEGCGDALPSLTDEQRRTALEIALADVRVAQILDQRQYEVEDGALWTAGTCLIGAVPRFRLAEPVTIEMEWPYFREGSDGRPIYPPHTARSTAVGLTELFVFVDLERREAVQITPLMAERLEDALTPGNVAWRIWGRLTYCPQ